MPNLPATAVAGDGPRGNQTQTPARQGFGNRSITHRHPLPGEDRFVNLTSAATAPATCTGPRETGLGQSQYLNGLRFFRKLVVMARKTLLSWSNSRSSAWQNTV